MRGTKAKAIRKAARETTKGRRVDDLGKLYKAAKWFVKRNGGDVSCLKG